MAIITAADFRAATVAEYCYDIQMETATAPDAALTATITRMTTKLQEYCDDSFESENLALSVSGDGISSMLLLPKRCTAISQIRTLASTGTYTVQTASRYRLKSSLYASGSRRVSQSALDWVEIVQALSVGWSWPSDVNGVEVTGTFGWTTCPGDIKRAVALMCWDHFKPQRGDLRRASRVSTQDTTTEYLPADPDIGVFTGISEVDDIIREYRRDVTVRVG